MRTQPLTTVAAGAVTIVVVLLWTLGLVAGDLPATPVSRLADGAGALLWQLTCLVAGLFVVLAARPALRRLDPRSRPGAAALLLQLGGVALVLLAVTPAAQVGEVLAEDDPAATYGTVATLVIGALLPAAGFLLAARWRGERLRRRETVTSFVASTVALWAMLASSLDPDGDWTGLAQRVAFTAALGWLAWLLARSLDPEQVA
ncbi:DUF998 domain-containing protein [Aeromicrobium sp. CF4.19]|uniref:DUF998 domain-containing protein n=1 Tax=Aeromicrobium sp. CF4.19 TaxID=3373082 RepID=UPI003EE6E20C